MKSDREGEPGLAWPYLFLILSDPHQSRGKPLFCWNNTEGVQIKEGTVLQDYTHEDLMVQTIGEYQIIQDPKFSISLDQDSNSNSNSTFIALNLYLMIDSKTQKAKIRDRNR